MVAGLLALVIFAAACGQKPGVHVQSAAERQQRRPTPTRVATGAAADTGRAQRRRHNRAPSAAPARPARRRSEGRRGGAIASGRTKVTGTNRTGVTADKITWSIHAPATGAAPLPVSSFRERRGTCTC